MTTHKNLSRRSFLQKSGSAGTVALSAPMVISQRAWGANDRIGLGIIGPGRRGQQLMGDFSRLEDAQFVAVSDVNRRRMQRVASGNDFAQYQDFRELLQDDRVDAVVVATPDHWHALHSIYACMAGKDVYVEKPMTLTVQEGREMVKAARRYDCVVQCGSQQRSNATSRLGCAIVRNGLIGEITKVHGANYPSPWEQPMASYPVPEGLDWDAWLGPMPPRGYHPELYAPRAKPGWISIMPYSGGEVTGWGAHGLDMIQWALGTDDTGPVEIWTEGNPRKLDRVVHMKYENGIELVMDNQGPQGGGRFMGSEGSLVVDRGRCETDPSSLGDVNEEELAVQLPKSSNHQQNFLDCVRSRERPIADVEIGHRSTVLCHMMNIARWAQRSLQWDPVNEQFVDDEAANEYLDRPRREPWQLPTV